MAEVVDPYATELATTYATDLEANNDTDSGTVTAPESVIGNRGHRSPARPAPLQRASTRQQLNLKVQGSSIPQRP